MDDRCRGARAVTDEYAMDGGFGSADSPNNMNLEEASVCGLQGGYVKQGSGAEESFQIDRLLLEDMIMGS